MRHVLLAVLLLLATSCSQAPRPACDSTEALVDEGWQNWRAERAYLDSTYLAQRDSLLEARHD